MHARPVADEDLRGLVVSYHRMRWWMLGVFAALICVAVGVLGTVVWSQHRQLVAQEAQIRLAHRQQETACAFFSDLGRVPVVATPPLKHPSLLGVTIISDSYTAAHGLGCAQLGPPSKSLAHWADYYHLSLP